MPHPQDLVKAGHVHKAAKRWKRDGYGSFRESLSYDVWINDEPYPPKAICALALDIATKGEITLQPADFPGLKGGDWHQRLTVLGFAVTPKADLARTTQLAIEENTPIDHWTQLDHLPTGFLAINVTNKEPHLYDRNTALLRDQQTGYWSVSKKVLNAGLIGQSVLLYFRDPSSGRRDLYHGVVSEARLYKSKKQYARDRYALRVDNAGWQLIGSATQTFSDFFDGEPIGTSPVCEWIGSPPFPQARPDSSPFLDLDLGKSQSSRPATHKAQAKALSEDIQEILRRAANGTEATRLVQARIGQGAFRQAVLRRWGNACAATGITEMALLRASHIKPWRDATDEERLSPYNGLPLTANLDALFDRGLISFDGAGYLHYSDQLDDETRESLNLPTLLRERPDQKMVTFLRAHWQAFGYEDMEGGLRASMLS